MPVRNGGSYLDSALASIRAQSFQEFEFLIVDDGSTDATPNVLARHAAEDARIRVLTAGGRGIVDALNQGLGAARSALVARMDADDAAEPNRIGRQVAEMEARPDLVLLGSAALRIDAQGRTIGTLAVETDPEPLAEAFRTRNPFLHPTVIMRRQAVEAAGGYRRQFTLAEDYELWTRLARLGALANLPDVLLRLRRHRNQSSHRHRREQRAVHALVRRTAWSPQAAPFLVAGPQTPVEAMTAYLTDHGRHASSPEARKDVGLILQWCLAEGGLSAERRRALAAAVGPGSSLLSALRREWRLLVAR
jgi:glycosyltransferase involved in cell wall biosynthesis